MAAAAVAGGAGGGGDTEEYSDDWADRGGQDGDCAAVGEFDGGAVYQGGGDEVYGGGLCGAGCGVNGEGFTGDCDTDGAVGAVGGTADGEELAAAAEERLVDLLLPLGGFKNWSDPEEVERRVRSREKIRSQLKVGAFDQASVEMTMTEKSNTGEYAVDDGDGSDGCYGRGRGCRRCLSG